MNDATGDEVPEDVRSTLESMERHTSRWPAGRTKEPYRFWPRLAMFVVVLVVAGALFAAVFIPLAIGMAMTAGGGGGGGLSGLLLVGIFVFVLAAAFFIFKR